AFANQHYLGAMRKDFVPKKALHVDVMSDEREQSDTVGPYRKSLLYLVSRSLETSRDEALLGMEWAWKKPASGRRSPWNPASDAAVDEWLTFWGDGKPPVQIHKQATVSNGPETIPLAHGSFDNDVAVV